MPFQEISRQGWGGRIVGSVGGALVGVLLFLVSFIVLWWNEGRAVQTERSLEEGAKAVVSVDADRADPANDGRLIHITAKAVTDETLADPDFGVRAPKALRLARKVEMYQYREEEHTETKKDPLGGGETTVKTYTYPLEWSEAFHDSNDFHDPDYRGKNPSAMPYHSDNWQAKKITAGAFTLSDRLASQIGGGEKLPVADKSAAPKLPTGYTVENDQVYKGKDPSAPQVGDVRASYTVVEPATVSVVAQQGESGSLGPYKAQAGDQIEMLETGEHDAASMFKTAIENNNTLTWVLRLVGFLMMAIGIFLVLRPLSVLGDVVPFIGNMIGALLALVAGMIALALSLITVSIAWLFYRPLIGVPLLLAGIVGIVLVVMLLVRRRTPAARTAG